MPPIHHFALAGVPVSVNNRGTPRYYDWREAVYDASIIGHAAGIMVPGPCTVKVKYFRRLDRTKDVDNILKAILDALQGLRWSGSPQAGTRILCDDVNAEKVVSQRTDVGRYRTVIDGLAFNGVEYSALLQASYTQASVYVRVDLPPDHNFGV